MPNWVMNIVKTEVKDFSTLLNKLVNEKDEVDFEKVTPIPKGLNEAPAGPNYCYKMATSEFTRGLYANQLKDQEEVLDKYFEKFYTDTITAEDFANEVVKNLDSEPQVKEVLNKYCDDKNHYKVYATGYFNKRRYSFTDWYEASVSLWGTKWNAQETNLYEQDCKVSFETAWSLPFPILLKIAQDIPFVTMYADEDRGSNYGGIVFKDGLAYDMLQILADEHEDVLANTSLSLFDYVVASAIWGEPNDNILEDIENMFEDSEYYTKQFNVSKEECIKQAEKMLTEFVEPYLDKFLIR